MTLPPTRMIDNCHRQLNYLRISITDRCNFRCRYCMPGHGLPLLSHGEILTYEEILHLVRVGVSMGITKVRVTGGEPLVRKGVCDFLERLTAVAGLKDVSLTTNGALLPAHIVRIHRAGIRRINVSLDTLKKDRFTAITGVDAFDRVWLGLTRALEMGFSPIKINVVAMAGVNDDELIDMADLSRQYPFHVRFIEHMPIGQADLHEDRPLMVPDIVERIRPLGPLTPVDAGDLDGPARRYRLPDAVGEIGFISSMSDHFCHTCNRLRLTANGQLRPCLLNDDQVDVKQPLRAGADDRQLQDLFLQAVRKKRRNPRCAPAGCRGIHSQMSSIGG